jgi:hypothetical protein
MVSIHVARRVRVAISALLLIGLLASAAPVATASA